MQSSSQGAGNALVNMPISFRVVSEFLAADFNLDGLVDGVDLTAWKTNYGLASMADKSEGDADLDGDVDGADFFVWQRQITPASALASSAAVPEPGAGLLLVLAAACVFAAPRRRRTQPSRST